ncbi:DUF2959 domain-containing protein [Endozoicomonas sp. SM1973]|uniref:DUF2959 domain-containing protein n=1 Tax=Spartinivicinus marinus TaxID=2994442 RepID=A0A853I3K5_9GAMM|nr:DUF2959 domain-containing protein [Spartinivicinus marinus]MCX4028532.1 DUF2959 domain-containing protein [Spartinivicinus marinus]NYZ67199.1 DUF2959 domain-containing protein [Spartinivicinus marinus]
MTLFIHVRSLFLLLLTLGLLSGCQTAYYASMEKLGYHKRDILINRVEDTQKAQQETQQQFKDALEQFKAVVQFDGGNLQETYDKLNTEYEDSKTTAENLRSHIEKVEDVAEALFDEWEEELALYSNATLKRDSTRKLQETKRQYKKLIASMWRAEKTIAPVLTTLHDQVLYLKHNLNARAIAALRGELKTVQKDVDRLLKSMQQAIRESQVFIQQMRRSQ